MKTIVNLFLLAFAVNLAQSQTSSEEVMEKVKAKYLSYLKNRRTMDNFVTQFEEVCPGSSERLEEIMLEIKECGDKIEEQSETACSAVRKHFMNCSKPMIQLLEECMPQQSKNVPKMIFQSLVSAANYLCKTDGEHIFELANSCIYQSNSKSLFCERKVRTKLQQYKKTTPTKSDICEFGNSMKPCLERHLRTACGNEVTRQAFLGAFDAFLAPCNEINDVEVVKINAEVESFQR